MSDKRADDLYTKDLWYTLEQHMNNDNFSGEYYAEMSKKWQSGWVGGGMSSLPLLKHGSEISRQRAIKTVDFMTDNMSPFGFFYTMIVDGSGMVTIVPVASSPSLTLDAAGAALLRPGIEYTLDYSDVPNRYIAVDDLSSAVAINDSPTSPTSTVTRGCFVDEYDSSPVRVSGETLGAYAQRRLRELSIVQSERTFTRKWVPDVYPGSVVRGSMASVELDGDMRIVTQRLECGAGIEVKERAVQEVSTWT